MWELTRCSRKSSMDLLARLCLAVLGDNCLSCRHREVVLQVELHVQ
jgi:hypothetical protein